MYITFLSLFFSAVSSLPALAACRFSCFAVNWEGLLVGWWGFGGGAEGIWEFTLRLKRAFSRPDIFAV